MHIVMNIAITYITITLYILITLRQCKKMLALSIREFRPVDLRRFIKIHTRIVVTLIQFQNPFGIIFTTIFSYAFAMSLIEVMLLITGNNLDFKQIFILCSMIFYNFVFIFGMHLACAVFTRRLHRPAKRLIQISQRYRSNSFRLHLRLNGYIEKFHTKKCYGFSYGGIGLITLLSFAKVKTTLH